MNDLTEDHPDVMVFPPVIPAVTLLLACLLQWFDPLGLLADVDRGARVVFGVLAFVVGLITTAAGRRALVRHGTNVAPSQPATVLVTEGVFRCTRNPLYVGVSLALCGIALMASIDWLGLLLIPSCIVLHFAVVRREETYLELKFGDRYRRYKDRVSRYLPGT